MSSGILQNTTSSSVDMYLTGTSFNSFSHGYTGSQILTADSTDLANITYNSIHPVSATIVEDGTIKHLTATFNFSDGASTAKSGGSLTIAANTIRNSTTQNSLITLTNGNITDAASPHLDVITPIGTTSDYTPDFTFSTTEAGTISYEGVCSSATTSATSGNNTVTFNPITVGAHSDCIVHVTDTATNAGSVTVTPFTITEGSYSGEYWNFGSGSSPAFDFLATPDFTRTDDSINFSWVGGSPNGAINADHFIARWTKTQYLSAGLYYFTIDHLDDGARLYVDDVLETNAWEDHGGAIYTVYETLTAGEHTIRLEFYENGGGAGIAFTYGLVTPPVISVVTPVPSPYSNLNPIYFIFNSDQSGTITYGGSCTSSDTSAIADNNTITFTSNTAGTYSDCTITVTNSSNMESNILAVPSFTVIDPPGTVYVDDDYTEEGENGGHTWGTDAFDNIADAYDVIAPNGTINIQAGTYISSSIIYLQKAVAISGPGKDSITPATVINNDCDYVFSVEASDVSISGLFIKETENDNSTYCNNKPVIRVLNDGELTSRTSITDNDISGGNKGVQLRGDSQESTVSNNTIHDGYIGISLASSKHNTISNNDIYDNQSYGVYLWQGDCGPYCDGNPSDNTISGNQIHANGFEDAGHGIFAENGSSNIFSGNHIYGNYKHGISLQISDVSAGHENIIQGNYIYENGLTATTNGAGPSGIEVQAPYTQILNNVISANARNGIQLGYNGGGYDHITITGNYIGSGTVGENQYTGNTEKGIYIRGGNYIEIHNNSIAGNINYGIYNETVNDVDATSNWWGSVNGPTHASNPGGDGDVITDHVLYDPIISTGIITEQFYVNDDYGDGEINDGHTWNVDAFSDIQTAINHATSGATIHIGAGSYQTSNTINVTIPVSIVGPGKDNVTPATVINDDCYYVFNIQASDVTISGLIIKQTNGDGETLCDSRPVIRVASNNVSNSLTYTAISNTTIHDNEIMGGYRSIVLRGDSNTSTITDNSIHIGGDGIFIASSKHNTINGNTIYNMDENAILIENGGCSDYFCDDRPSDNNISENTFRNNGESGIRIDASHAYSNTISTNNIYENGKHGIKIYVSDNLTEEEANIISDNNIYGNGVNMSAGSNGYGPAGVEVQADYTQITNNIISQNRRNGIQIGGDTSGIDHVTITGNTIGSATINSTNYSGNTERGIYIQNGQYDEIHENNISGNGDIGILNTSGNEADATNNWWGNASGPYQEDTNPSGDGDEVSSDVLYDPYASTSFGEVPPIYVDDDYTVEGENDGHTLGVDAFDNLPDAINEAQSGATIHVAQGTYISSNTIEINKSISIIGPGIVGGAEAGANIINNNCRYVFSVFDSNVTLQGLFIAEQNEQSVYCRSYPAIRVLGGHGSETIDHITIEENNIGGGYRGIQLRGDSSYSTITHNLIHDARDGISLASSKNNTITGNEVFNNSDKGIYFWWGDCGSYCDGNTDNNTISSNNIYNNEHGIYLEAGKDNTFSENSIHDNNKNGIAIHNSQEIAEGHGNIVDDNDVYHNGYQSETDGPGPAGIDAASDYTQVTNNTVSDNKYTGIKIGGGDFNPANVTVTGNTIGSATIGEDNYEGNTGYGVYVYRGSGHIIHHNIIKGNAVGLYNNSDNSVDARENYWGSVNGPTTPTNPDGDGDSIESINDYLGYDYGEITATTAQVDVDINDGSSFDVDYRAFFTDENFGAVNEDENTTPIWTERGVQYGLTTEYGLTNFESGLNITSGQTTFTLENLTCNTQYHFRVYGVSGGSNYFGGNVDFNTGECTDVNLDEGIIAHWKFNEGTGTTALDSTNNNNDGTLGSGTSWTEGKYGSAIHFDGTGAVDVPVNQNIPIGNDTYSISAWFKSSEGHENQGIIGWGDYGSNNYVTALRTSYTGECSGGNGFRHYWWSNDLDACATILDNTWHQVVAEYDGTVRRIFLDGVQIASNNPGAHAVPNTNNLAIGVTNFDGYFVGDIDDVLIYDRALNTSEITALYESTTDEFEADPPTVSTGSASSITETSAVLNGTINDTGSTDVTSRGFNYGATQSYGGNVSSTGNFSSGSFNNNIGGLTCATIYHFRAYATNSVGTSYGSDHTFTSVSCPGAVAGAFAVAPPSVTNTSVPNTNNSNITGSTENSGGITKAGLPDNFSFLKDIKPSNKNLDVKMLQIFLNNNNFIVSKTGDGAKGKENNFFGKKTKNALIRFQETHAKEILTPQGLKKGTGILGPYTRKVINTWLEQAKN